MKAIIALAVLASMPAFASSTPAVVSCMSMATMTLGLTIKDAAELCKQASGHGPVACYRGALARYPLIHPTNAATLCQGAVSHEPVNCLELLIGLPVAAPIGEAAKACQGAHVD